MLCSIYVLVGRADDFSSELIDAEKSAELFQQEITDETAGYELPQCPALSHQALCDFESLSYQDILSHRSCHIRADSGAAEAALQDRFNGLPIHRVVVHRYNVFDKLNPDEDSRFYQGLNRIHVVTKRSVILSQLLFKENDIYDADRVQESARILRSRGYFSSAVVIPVLCNERLTILVATQDSWGLEPEISASRKGGENNTAFALTEDNLFGTGSEIAIGYESDAERDRYFVNYFTPHVFNTPYAVSFGYGETSDGNDFSVALVKPFISLLTESSFGVGVTQQNFLETIDQNEVELTAYQRQTRRINAFYGHAFEISGKRSQRWTLGLSQIRDRFDFRLNTRARLPADERVNSVWGEYSLIENDFAVLENLNFIGQLEDIQLGRTARLRLGLSPSGWNDANTQQFPYELEYSRSFLKENWYTNFTGRGTGAYAKSSAARSHARFFASLSTSYALNLNNRVSASYRLAFTENVRPHEQILLGGESGMRGYPLEYRRGKLQSVVTIDRRIYTDWHWFNIARVGWLLFADFGTIHEGPDARLGFSYPDVEENEILADVGFGLRLNSSKTKTDKVLHVDVAFPLIDADNIDTFQLTLTAQSSF